jgi:hypothetical protein
MAKAITFAPRLMRAVVAAAYLGMSETKFRELVQAGKIARPKRQDGLVSWDVRDLDAFADALPRDDEPINNDWAGVSI